MTKTTSAASDGFQTASISLSLPSPLPLLTGILSSGEAQGENWIGFGEDQGKEKEAEEEFHRYNSSARGCFLGGEVERQVHCRG